MWVLTLLDRGPCGVWGSGHPRRATCPLLVPCCALLCPGPCWDCPAPVLTYFKNAHADDILVPIALKSMDHPLYLFPWEKKKVVGGWQLVVGLPGCASMSEM